MPSLLVSLQEFRKTNSVVLFFHTIVTNNSFYSHLILLNVSSLLFQLYFRHKVALFTREVRCDVSPESLSDTTHSVDKILLFMKCICLTYLEISFCLIILSFNPTTCSNFTRLGKTYQAARIPFSYGLNKRAISLDEPSNIICRNQNDMIFPFSCSLRNNDFSAEEMEHFDTRYSDVSRLLD